jgi:hypothetical protein
MPLDAFQEELTALLNASVGAKFEDIEKAVAALHAKHGREVPPPIKGTMEAIDPEDRFGD